MIAFHETTPHSSVCVALDSAPHRCYIPNGGLMAGSRKAGPTAHHSDDGFLPAKTPGPLGVNDQGDPNVLAFRANTPGPAGVRGFEPPRILAAGATPMVSTPASNGSPTNGRDPENRIGSAPVVGTGVASIARIRVPGTDYLVEFSPRNFPASKSTSALFIQDKAARRVLRLDYGHNQTTGQVDYHWNQERTFADFGIKDHTVAGSTGEALFKGAKLFKYGGRALLIVGVAMDAYSIVVAKKRWRQVARVAAGWAGAAAGAEFLGAWGAGVGTVDPAGTAVGETVGGIVGGIAGYAGASWATGEIYDWVEETYFEPVPSE